MLGGLGGLGGSRVSWKPIGCLTAISQSPSAGSVTRLQKHPFLLAVCSLSGSRHHVHTGVVLVLPRPGRARSSSSSVAAAAAPELKDEEPLVVAFSSSTAVTFDHLDEATVRAYIESGEPFGKAGEA